MEITLPISSLLIIAVDSVGITISLFIGFCLLIQKNKNHISVTILGLLLILTGITLINDMLVTSGISNRFPWLYFAPIYFSLSIGPLFYLFVKSKYKSQLQTNDLWHLLLPLIQGIIYFAIGFRDMAFKSHLWQETDFPLYLNIESFLFPATLISYTLASLRVLKNGRNENYFWSEDLKTWLHRFSIGMIIIALLELTLSLMEFFSFRLPLNFPYVTVIHALVISSFAFWIAINGLKQYFPLNLYTSGPKNPTNLIASYDVKAFVAKLHKLMNEDKIFLSTDLNLQLLAKYLNVSEKMCSHIINTEMQTNFNAFINKYRIREFKERLQQGKSNEFTLTGIAYECGFNSKSTFNRVFKKECGFTPSEFLKQTKIS